MGKDLVLLLSAPGLQINNVQILDEFDRADRWRRKGYLSLTREGVVGLSDEFERWIVNPHRSQIHPRFADGGEVWVTVVLRNDREGYNPPVLRRLERALRVDWREYRSSLRVAIVTCGPRELHPGHVLLQYSCVQPPRHAHEPTFASVAQTLRQLVSDS